MPVLPAEYVSSWYILQDQMNDNANSGTIRVVEKWNEKQRVKTTQRNLIQGDIGTHVVDVGGMVWETTVSSPILIFATPLNDVQGINHGTSFTLDNGKIVSSIYDLLLTNITNIFTSTTYQTVFSKRHMTPCVLSSAEITFNENNVSCTMVLQSTSGMSTLNTSTVGDVTGAGIFIAISPNDIIADGGLNYIARTAMFYDTFLTLPDDFNAYAIMGGSIKIKSDIKETYLINTLSQLPFLSVQGYQVSGDLKVVSIPTGQAVGPLDTLGNLTGGTTDHLQQLNIDQQAAGTFTTNLSANPFSVVSLTIAGITIPFLGDTQVVNSVDRSMAPNSVVTATVSFECFARYTPS